jgi:hypothetical protein
MALIFIETLGKTQTSLGLCLRRIILVEAENVVGWP